MKRISELVRKSIQTCTLARFICWLGLLAVLLLSAPGAQAQLPPNSIQLRVDDPVQSLRAGQTVVISIVSSLATPAYGFGFQVRFDPAMVQVFPRSDPDGSAAPFILGPLFSAPQRVKNAEEAVEGGSQRQVDVVYTLLPPAQAVSGEGILGTIAFTILAEGQTEITLLHPRLIEVVEGTARDILVTPASSTITLTISSSGSSVSGGAGSGPDDGSGPGDPLIVIIILLVILLIGALMIIAILFMRQRKQGA